jgi:hypothetical protein
LLAGAPSKAARALIIAVAALHFALSLVLWFGFLNIGGSVKNMEPVLGGNQPEGDI